MDAWMRGKWGDGEMGRLVYECIDEWRQGCMVVLSQVWHSRKKSKFKYYSRKIILQVHLINNPRPNKPSSPFPHFPISPSAHISQFTNSKPKRTWHYRIIKNSRPDEHPSPFPHFPIFPSPRISQFTNSKPKRTWQYRIIKNSRPNEPPSPIPHFPNSPALPKPNIPTFHHSNCERSQLSSTIF